MVFGGKVEIGGGGGEATMRGRLDNCSSPLVLLSTSHLQAPAKDPFIVCQHQDMRSSVPFPFCCTVICCCSQGLVS